MKIYKHSQRLKFPCAGGRIRTCDLGLMKTLLLTTELRRQFQLTHLLNMLRGWESKSCPKALLPPTAAQFGEWVLSTPPSLKTYKHFQRLKFLCCGGGNRTHDLEVLNVSHLLPNGTDYTIPPLTLHWSLRLQKSILGFASDKLNYLKSKPN